MKKTTVFGDGIRVLVGVGGTHSVWMGSSRLFMLTNIGRQTKVISSPI